MQNYANKTPDQYGASGLATHSQEAWNLAFLSHDYSKGLPKDPSFGVHIHRSLQWSARTGEWDRTGLLPEYETLKPWLAEVPPRFVKLLHGVPEFKLRTLPLYQAYGTGWMETIERRAHLYREPFHPVHDFHAEDLSLSRAHLARIFEK